MWTDTLDRAKLIELAYQRGKELNLNNRNYLSWLEKFFDQEYKEDIGSGDMTSEALLTKNKLGSAGLKAKQSGIVGGIEEVCWFYKKHGLKVKIHAEDAKTVETGDTILEVHGKRKEILATERIGLNVMQRMSGIATETRHLVDLLRDHKTRIAATRKTNWRYLDKKAVFLGGGLTHRFGLWDSILIKDNHLEALKNDGIKDPVEKAIALSSRFVDKVGFIEIETANQDDALKAARKFKQLKLKKPCIIMLDNVAPNEIAQIIEPLKSENLYDYMLLEASGNITTGNIKEYAKTGVDVVSLGCLTHSAKIFDMSLEITL
jgi:nicotinate-nucleotide pyrophosphorylase (carboxylating)